MMFVVSGRLKCLYVCWCVGVCGPSPSRGWSGVSTLPDLEVADVLEDEGVVNVDGLADLVVHGVDVGLVDGHALPGQGRGVVYGDVVELRVVLPVLIWVTHTQTRSQNRSGASLEQGKSKLVQYSTV